MKHLFLTSQVQYVAKDIAPKIDDSVKQNSVFITTAIRDKEHTHLEWHYTNKSQMEAVGFHFVDYDLTGKTATQIKTDLEPYRCVYVEGGNSFYLLQESQNTGFDRFINERVEAGVVYIGTSAGSVIAGPDIKPVYQASRAALAPKLTSTLGYGLVNFVVMPHWGQEKRRELYNTYRLNHIYQEDYLYLLLSDYQYVEVKDDSFQICGSKN